MSLDLIYGTPGESPADWQASLDAALALTPDHVSAYALIVEDGTRLAGRVRRGELAAPDDDDLADKYLMADAALSARRTRVVRGEQLGASAEQRCAHNLVYWQGADWWGVGSRARTAMSAARGGGTSSTRRPTRPGSPRGPVRRTAREVLTDEQRRFERVLLGIRLVDGHPLDDLHDPDGSRRAALAARGLLDQAAYDDGRAALTLRGRLLADAVVRDLT